MFMFLFNVTNEYFAKKIAGHCPGEGICIAALWSVLLKGVNPIYAGLFYNICAPRGSRSPTKTNKI